MLQCYAGCETMKQEKNADQELPDETKDEDKIAEELGLIQVVVPDTGIGVKAVYLTTLFAEKMGLQIVPE